MADTPINIFSGNAPNDGATMLEKQKAHYGYEYAAYMWQTYWLGMTNVGLRNWDDYMYLRSVAHGRESMENVKRYLNLVNAEKTESYTWFNVNVLNFATRFINLVKEKLNQMEYDISVEAIDPLSVSEKDEFAKTAKAILQARDLLEVYGKKYEEIMPSFPAGWQPSSVQEIDVYMETNHKIKDEIKAELDIIGDLDFSNWAHVKNMMYDDWLTCGPAVCRVFRDYNGDRKVKYVPIERWICSTPDDESFDNIVHAGHVEYITAEQFRWETAATYNTQEQDKILAEQASYQGYGRYDNNGMWFGGYFPDGKRYVAVLRFEFLASDRKVWVKSMNEKGKVRIDPKEDDYVPGTYTVSDGKGGKKRITDDALMATEKAKFDSGKKQMIVDDRKSCYGGSWVIGSTYCYNYGLLESGKDVKLGYKAWAPNMRQGFVTSMTKQILEPLELANIAHTKAKQILAQGFMGIVDVDISALSNVAMGKGGAEWTAKQIMDLFYEKQIGVHNTVQNGNGGSAFTIQNSGLTLRDYLDTIAGCINNMISITGVNPNTETGTNISAESMNVANQATNDALGYLYRAYHQVYKAVGRQFLGYNPAFYGNWTYQRRFLVGAVPSPTQADKQMFMARLNKYSSVPLADGGLTVSQEAFISNIKNIKQANLVLAYWVKKNMEIAQQNQLQLMQQQGQINDKNAQNASNIKRSDMEFEAMLKATAAEKAHEYKMEEIALENEGVVVARQIQMDWTHKNVRQVGADSILKEAIRSESDQRDTAAKNAKDLQETALTIVHDHEILNREQNHEHQLTDKEHAHDHLLADKEREHEAMLHEEEMKAKAKEKTAKKD